MTHKVIQWTVIEGQLYEVDGGENGVLTVFDSEVVAVTPNGLFRKDFVVKGFAEDKQEHITYANFRYKEECLAIIAKLSKDDVEIDEADGWVFLPPNESLETCLAAEADIENAERHCLPPINYPYQHYTQAPYARPEPEEFVCWRGDSDGSVGVD